MIIAHSEQMWIHPKIQSMYFQRLYNNHNEPELVVALDQRGNMMNEVGEVPGNKYLAYIIG